jgi:predicted TIM-barrel fold metal-dependent hydrolase
LVKKSFELLKLRLGAVLAGKAGSALDAFGLDRCMWGTDWTRTIGMLTYEQGVTPFRDTKRLSEDDKAALMGGTLQKVYKW